MRDVGGEGLLAREGRFQAAQQVIEAARHRAQFARQVGGGKARREIIGIKAGDAVGEVFERAQQRGDDAEQRGGDRQHGRGEHPAEQPAEAVEAGFHRLDRLGHHQDHLLARIGVDLLAVLAARDEADAGGAPGPAIRQDDIGEGRRIDGARDAGEVGPAERRRPGQDLAGRAPELEILGVLLALVFGEVRAFVDEFVALALDRHVDDHDGQHARLRPQPGVEFAVQR